MMPGLAGGLRDPAPRLRVFAASGLPRFPEDPGHRPDHDMPAPLSTPSPHRQAMPYPCPPVVGRWNLSELVGCTFEWTVRAGR